MILITGATGYIGRKIAENLLSDSSTEKLLLWLHAKNEDEFTTKRNTVSAHLATQLPDQANRLAERVSFAYGDLSQDEAFANVDVQDIQKIIHSAAVTAFNVDAERADRVNFNGTRRVLEFAERCPQLELIAQVSTVYTSGLRQGSVTEQFYDNGSGFANHYERSKWEAERLLQERFKNLPWQIYRVATILADDDSGRVLQYNAVHNTLMLLYYGLISILPGRAETPVYLVTGEFTARAVTEGLKSPLRQQFFHVAHQEHESLRLNDIIDIAYDAFLEDPAFKGRRVLKPLLADADSFDSLVKGVTAFGGHVLSQAVSSIAPFGHQLFIAKSVDNTNLRSVWPAYRAPHAKELLKQTCRDLVLTKFGKRERV